MIPAIIAALLALSGAFIVAYPLLGLGTREVGAGAVAMDERERALKQALRDVDFDYRLGNLDEGDYSALRTRYETGALAALKERLTSEREIDARIDREVTLLRTQQARRAEKADAGNGHKAQGEQSRTSGKNGNTGSVRRAAQNGNSGKNGNNGNSQTLRRRRSG